MPVLKILTLVWSVGAGGTERAAVNCAIGYKMYGCNSRVLVLGEGEERKKDLEMAGVDTVFLLKENKEQVMADFKNWLPDIIHIHNISPALCDYINQVRSPKSKVVETNHFSRPVYHRVYKTVDLSLQLTSWGCWRFKRRIHSANHIPLVSVVPNIVDTAKFLKPTAALVSAFLQQQGIPAGAFVAGRLGQAHPSKWHSGLLDVIKSTINKNNNIYYLLVGVPAQMKSVISHQNEFFKTRVKLIDKLDGDDQLSLYYHSLDCFVHWSPIGESFGYVLTEAMLCGVPVVTMLTPLRDNGQFEVVGNEKGGLCVSGKKEFIRSVLALYQQPDLLRTIRNNLGNEWVQKRFSFEAVIPQLLKRYGELLQGQKVEENYNSSIVRSFFSFYGKNNFLKAALVKLTNTACFYRLAKFIK